MKTKNCEKTKGLSILTLLLLILLSLLIHLFFFGTFLKYGFQMRTPKFFTSVTRCLTPEQKKVSQDQAEKRHQAIKQIFQKISEKRKPKPWIFNEQKLKETSNKPAKLIAPKSNFGWVIFDNQIEQPEKLEIPDTKQGEIGISQHGHATAAKPHTEKPTKPSSDSLKRTDILAVANNMPVSSKNVEMVENKPYKGKQDSVKTTKDVLNIQKKIEEIQKLQKKVESYIKSKDANEAFHRLKSVVSREITPKPNPDIALAKADHRANLSNCLKHADILATANEELPEQTRELTKEEEKNIILSDILCKDKKSVDSNQPNSSCVWGSGIQKNNDKNLIKLTKGYIEKLQGESGTDLIDRDGDPNKKPSFEELKYISYESKINWCLQSSWKNNFAHNQAFHAMESKAVIEFTIDESGKVIKYSMLQSTGHSDVDNAIIKNLQFASPFPPLPKHFGTKTYTTGRSITVYAQRFGL